MRRMYLSDPSKMRMILLWNECAARCQSLVEFACGGHSGDGAAIMSKAMSDFTVFAKLLKDK
jgi:hypothetical protein